MSVVVLEPYAAPAVPLEAPEIRPDAFAALSEAEIARLPVWHGNETAQIGDFFRVKGGRSADVRIAGGRIAGRTGACIAAAGAQEHDENDRKEERKARRHRAEHSG